MAAVTMIGQNYSWVLTTQVGSAWLLLEVVSLTSLGHLTTLNQNEYKWVKLQSVWLFYLKGDFNRDVDLTI